MAKIIQSRFALLCCSLWLWMGAASLSHAAEREFVSQWVALGNASFKKGTQIPMYGITVESPMDDGVLKDFSDCHHPHKDCQFQTTIPTLLKDRLQLIQVPDVGNLLIPREWHTIQAGIGVDGSSSVAVYAQQIDKSSRTAPHLAYYNAGACVGCAYSNASLYFDNAVRLAKENDFTPAQRPANLHLVKVNAKKVIFSRPISATLEMNGVAYFDPNSDEPYSEKTVILPITEHALATVLLNF